MVPLALAFALLALICVPLALIALQGIRWWREPTGRRKRGFWVAILTGPLLVPAWMLMIFLAGLGWVPRPPLPDPGSGEAVMCAVLGGALAFGTAAIIVNGMASILSRRRRTDVYDQFFDASLHSESRNGCESSRDGESA